MKQDNYGLLPFIREDISSLNNSSGQFIGWEILKLNVQKAWPHSQGEGVVVAVIDTGCDLNHNDIKNNLLNGYNVINPEKEPDDDNGHGTHVSSTIAAENNGFGMVGVAPKSKIRPVKALDKNGNGSPKHIVKAINWSIDQKVDIITMSLGSPANNQEIYKAIKRAYDNKISVFCAAGNSGENSDILYPAKYIETISIGAIDEHFQRTNFTCSGEELDFLAPGHNIFGAVPGNKYALMSGTSMSNPFAVGCACLLISKFKKIKYSATDAMADGTESLRSIFKKNAIQIEDSKYKSKKYQGYGIIRPL